jgi:hypothetical protein
MALVPGEQPSRDRGVTVSFVRRWQIVWPLAWIEPLASRLVWRGAFYLLKPRMNTVAHGWEKKWNPERTQYFI